MSSLRSFEFLAEPDLDVSELLAEPDLDVFEFLAEPDLDVFEFLAEPDLDIFDFLAERPRVTIKSSENCQSRSNCAHVLF